MDYFGRKKMKSKKKESLFTKYIKMFYGVSGPLDEYKRQAIIELEIILLLLAGGIFLLLI
ncbi:DUF3278 domain-containing protein [Apilactobacillus micheneri]|nr:DUF3278 domain-containing protein [Apilactobacillus micheneri]TPR50629.1 DUF3278 domain-containing protein [Apilactobacillus micheneri]